MHKDLADWLWKTWKKRYKLMAEIPDAQPGEKHRVGRMETQGRRRTRVRYHNKAVDEIYRDYKASKYNPQKSVYRLYEDNEFISEDPENYRKRNENFQLGELTRFRYNVLKIARENQLNHVIVQGLPDGPLETNRIMSTDPALFKTFVHFYPKRGEGNFRVYMNMKDSERCKLFQKLLMNVTNIDGFVGGKVAPPGSSRRDNALFYTKTQAAQTKVVDHIRENWDKIGPAFYPGVPRLTLAARGLRGVGIATSPPRIQIVSAGSDLYYEKTGGVSFGMYRSHLIFMALDRSDLGPKWRDVCSQYWKFKKRAEEYFIAAGIDVDKPHEQYLTKPLLPLSELSRRVGAANANNLNYETQRFGEKTMLRRAA